MSSQTALPTGHAVVTPGVKSRQAENFKETGIQACRDLNDSVPAPEDFGVWKSLSGYPRGPGRLVGGGRAQGEARG